MNDSEPQLFYVYEQPTAADPRLDRPLCRRCGIEPASWNGAQQKWRATCGIRSCESDVVLCRNCDVHYNKGTGRNKYCSVDCMREANGMAPRPVCITCGNDEPYGSGRTWTAGSCTTCWRQIDQDRRKALISHRVSLARALGWQSNGWKCDLCGDYVAAKTGAVDHDHTCCPTSKSCGKCVRGYLHNRCNTGIGAFGDSKDWLMQAIDYLDRYSIR
jgi:hypothetical protein